MSSAPEDLTAHEIIVLSREYHLSVHFPQGSLYADVWLGINAGTSDILVHVSEMRRQALNTSPPSETSSDSGGGGGGGPAVVRKDSGCGNASGRLTIRHSRHGLSNCPGDRRAVEWLVAKESLFEAQSICSGHHAKFSGAVGKMQKHNHARLPCLAPLLALLDDMRSANALSPGPPDSPTCAICRASPYTRLFFSML
ncbi:hypothetical protein GGI04_003991 [Coemansia thaxteri]|uniref:Uncharacterized protein n=1 Tax=Coemansia thaxteri TaxID=2663907 RepID=A0A9W8BGG9_9FUNG|nr:hypothetical protein GGI04_003991 [Coemansia thaxteri]KAJ2004503.1 hypothetical protein H4R26_002485 [Coemansia thaxteri]KAJ2465648.1 hypothetical protein GGI02_004629 [Coemansia sp. RSA 2322]KAJ2484341.1 hypothetical protein EV174_002500 [Coemansia sp. RSA 2320]